MAPVTPEFNVYRGLKDREGSSHISCQILIGMLCGIFSSPLYIFQTQRRTYSHHLWYRNDYRTLIDSVYEPE